MTTLNPAVNQNSFPISVGLLGATPRVALLCPSTGLLLDNVIDAVYFWSSSTSLKMSLKAPSGYTVRAVNKPHTTVEPTIKADGNQTFLSRPFPATGDSTVANFNIVVSSIISGEVVAWHDPTWPVKHPPSGGPSSLVSEQTNYYYMATDSFTIRLQAKEDSGVVWLQTQYGAIVGNTLVASPPQDSRPGDPLALTVSIDDGTSTPPTVVLNTEVGRTAASPLAYSLNGVSATLEIYVEAQPVAIPAPQH